MKWNFIRLADNSSRRVSVRIRSLGKLTAEGVEYASYRSALGLRKEANRQILEKPKHGRVYISRDRAGRRRRHVASAPGETHANLTGKMRKSLGFAVGQREIEFGFGVLPNNPAPAKYPPAIEFGSKKRKIKPRRSAMNAIRAERRNFQANFDREIGKRLGGRGTIRL